MKYFDIGETVICAVRTKQEGILKDPDSLQISIYKPDGTVDINLAPMSRDDMGIWHYDYDTAGKGAGNYRGEVKAVTGLRIKLANGSFRLQ